jgi:hypothetical protein
MEAAQCRSSSSRARGGPALQTKLRLRRVLEPTRPTLHQSSSRGRCIRSEPRPGYRVLGEQGVAATMATSVARGRRRQGQARWARRLRRPLTPRRPPAKRGNYRRKAKRSGRRGDPGSDFAWRSTHSQRHVRPLRRAIGSSGGERDGHRRLSASVQLLEIPASRFQRIPPGFRSGVGRPTLAAPGGRFPPPQLPDRQPSDGEYWDGSDSREAP